MFQFKYHYIFFIFTIGILIKNSDCYCSTGCTYSYQSAGNYVEKCILSNPDFCTACDPLFYDPVVVSGACVLPPYSIYNTTVIIPRNNWQYNLNPATSPTIIINGFNWNQLDPNSLYTELINMSQPFYGFRCRILLHSGNRNNDAKIFFIVNNTSYRIQNLLANDMQYSLNQWIYTTPFIQYSSSVVRLVINRTDTSPPGLSNIGFHDVRCFFAYCTPNCLACTSTDNCFNCESGYNFDTVAKICVSTCPLGRFQNVTNTTCLPCDVRCQLCTDYATNCTKCTSSGPYQSFLQLATTSCEATCADGIPNYLTHKCQCGPQNFTINITTCAPCPTYCKYCINITICIQCHIGYFMINGTTTCSASCPPGQYINLIYDLKQCLQCDLTLCLQCVNSPSICTSCAFLSLDRYLFNNTCLYICPDGYQGNNLTSTCDLCPLGLYSFQNICYTQCPQYYYANDDIRACVLPGGYPLNMTVEVEGANTLRFTIPLPLGLSNSSLINIATNWLNYISLSFITQNTSSLILNKRRTLAIVISQTLAISNAIITNNSIILYSSSISADRFIYTHSFMARFDDNLVSPKNVIYSIKAKTSTDDNPWYVSQYFNMNLKPFFLIGIFLSIFGLLMILMRTKYVYRILIEYIHSIQLIGLTFYAIYPHSLHIDLYSFLMGLDFANFSFIINLPAKFIPSCKQCICLVSYNFAIGDMNWLRMMGPLIFCLTAMVIFCMVIYAFECSRKYSSFYLNLVIDLVLIKTIHGWFASFLFSGLNFSYDNLDLDLFVLSMHMLSYFILIPILYTRIKAQLQNKQLNISFIFLVIYIILITLLSIGPSVICALLILTSFTQWSLNIGLNIGQDQKSVVKQNNDKVVLKNQDAAIVKVHNHLLRLIKPITAFLIAIVIMADDQVVPISVVSAVLAVIFIFIIVNTYFLYEHYKLSKVQDKFPAKSNSINQTKQDIKADKDTEIRDKQLRIYDEDDMDDDGVVGKRFRKNKIQTIQPTLVDARNASQFFKNVQ